jgi:hypothetical protein
MQKTLRQLIDHLEHIEQGGEFNRVRDLVTGRIINEAPMLGARKWPTTDAEIRAFQQANPPLKVDGLIGQETLAKLKQLGMVPPAGFKPVANKAKVPGAAPAGNLGSAGPEASTDSSAAWKPSIAGQNADGSFNSDHPFVKSMDKKMAAAKNPNGNGGHDGSNIAPDADPADPKLWPTGVKAAPDFGYLDPQGMWIPTPYHERTEEGNWKVPRTSPANLVGIPMNQWTPFQQKLEQLKSKNTSVSSSAIEKQVPMQLPGGAPQIPGYKQIDASRFSTDAREPGLNKTLDWLYAYQQGKNIILIAPMLFPGMKLSIGRYYKGWDDNIGNIRSGGGALKTANGTIHVSGLSFNYNDMIFDVVVHSTDPKVGPQVLQTIKI